MRLLCGQILAVALALPVWAQSSVSIGPGPSDERSGLEFSGYLGTAVDSFAAQESNNLLHAGDSGRILLNYIAGMNFAYRLAGHAEKDTRPQLWVYGKTIYSQRSTEAACDASSPAGICQTASGTPPSTPGPFFYAILRNASSLEAYTGARLEFLTLPSQSDSSAKLYAKSELGFLTVSGSGGDVIDSHQKIALGAIITRGTAADSYFEAGYGRTDLFQIHRGRRFKVDGYVTFRVAQLKSLGLRPFFEMVVDADFGRGSDSARTYFGFNFDLAKLFP